MTKNPLSNDELVELISRRRRQILVHSVIYYRLNDSVISDHVFDEWSRELVELQAKYPEVAAKCDWHEGFKDFDGSSGFDLPIHDPRALNAAYRVLNYAKNV